jgi:biotin carboxyl carrier protein
MPCRIIKIHVKDGSTVAKGDPLWTMESMKMEITQQAHQDGIVKQVFVKEGQVIDAGVKLIDFEVKKN